MSPPEQTYVVWIGGMPEPAARRLADALGELLDAQEAAISQYEAADAWTVAIHFRHRPDPAIEALIAQQAGADAAVSTETVASQDWVAASLAGLTPVQAGRVFLHGAHDRGQAPPNAIEIEIEAALAFGTGHHGTTTGCLLALDALAKARRPLRITSCYLPLQGGGRTARPSGWGCRMQANSGTLPGPPAAARPSLSERVKGGGILDVGTGTGVLAIAAARAFRRPVLASDIDPQAVRVARANVRANRAGSLVTVVQAAGLAGAGLRKAAPYDLIFANILLGPLLRLAAPLARLTAPGGRIVLSGLLVKQANAVLAAYRGQRLYLERRIVLDGWVTLVLVAGRGTHP